jgi:hypothetical protein
LSPSSNSSGSVLTLHNYKPCDVDKVKTEPDDFEEEELKKDMKALEDQDEGQTINASAVINRI